MLLLDWSFHMYYFILATLLEESEELECIRNIFADNQQVLERTHHLFARCHRLLVEKQLLEAENRQIDDDLKCFVSEISALRTEIAEMETELSAYREIEAMTKTAAACANQVVHSSASSCTVVVDNLEFNDTSQSESGPFMSE